MIQRCVVVVLVLRTAYCVLALVSCCVLRTLSYCVLALVSCCVLRTCSRGMHLRGRCSLKPLRFGAIAEKSFYCNCNNYKSRILPILFVKCALIAAQTPASRRAASIHLIIIQSGSLSISRNSLHVSTGILADSSLLINRRKK